MEAARGRRDFSGPQHSKCDFLPALLSGHPGIRENLGRRQTWTLVDRRPTGPAAHARLDFPTPTVGADEDIASATAFAAAVPPMTFKLHCPTQL
jgi:hypothetical protein